MREDRQNRTVGSAAVTAGSAAGLRGYGGGQQSMMASRAARAPNCKETICQDTSGTRCCLPGIFPRDPILWMRVGRLPISDGLLQNLYDFRLGLRIQVAGIDRFEHRDSGVSLALRFCSMGD